MIFSFSEVLGHTETMLLFVKSDGDVKEWFMIEMQGDLESRNKEHLEGKFIGDLHYTKQGMLFKTTRSNPSLGF